jgi:hypothetical protein
MTRFRGVLMLSGSLFIGGLVAGTLFPTKGTDSAGRRFNLWCLVFVLTSAVFFVCDALYSVVSGEKVW